MLQRKLYSLPNVEVITSALTSEVKGDGQKVTGLVYKDRNSEEFKSIELEGIFVQIGLLPNTEWLKGSVELSPRGRSSSTPVARPRCPASSPPAT